MNFDAAPKNNDTTAAVKTALEKARAQQPNAEVVKKPESVELKFSLELLTTKRQRRALEGNINGNKVIFYEVRIEGERNWSGEQQKEEFEYGATVNGEKLSPEDAERAWKKYVSSATDQFPGATEESKKLEEEKAAYRKTLEGIGLAA